jgi:ketosteroid isomerase-like protein
MAHPEDLARRMLELTDRQDWPSREALLTEDCELVTPAGPLRGRAATTAFSAPFVGAFPDARHGIDLIASARDTVVVEGHWVGTHTGPLATPGGEVPATGRAIDLPYAVTMRVSGDLVASMHVYFDQLAFLAQLGLVPQPQAA